MACRDRQRNGNLRIAQEKTSTASPVPKNGALTPWQSPVITATENFPSGEDKIFAKDSFDNDSDLAEQENLANTEKFSEHHVCAVRWKAWRQRKRNKTNYRSEVYTEQSGKLRLGKFFLYIGSLMQYLQCKTISDDVEIVTLPTLQAKI